MKRRRTTTTTRPPEHPGEGTREHPGVTIPGPKCAAAQPQPQPDVVCADEHDAAPLLDMEVPRDEGAREASDQESVHEPGTDEWLDAELGPEQAEVGSRDAQRQ